MNKQKFSKISGNPDLLESADIDSLTELSKSYPYSQIIHSLLAKAHQSAKSKEAKSVIGIAAMYATDRQLLKEIVTKKKVEESASAEQVNEPKQEDKLEEIKKKPEQKKITIDTSSFIESSSSNLRNEILNDLDKLKSSKAYYLQTLGESETLKIEDVQKEKEDKVKLTRSTSTKTKAKSTKKTTAASKTNTAKPTTAKTKKTVVKKSESESASKPKKSATTKTTSAKKSTTKKVAATKTSSKSTTTAKKAIPAKASPEKAVKKADEKKIVKKVTLKKVEKTPAKKVQTKKPAASNKTVKKKPELSQKVKEQQKIINDFIEKEPSISSKTMLNVSSDQQDLAEKSTNFGEDLISENLAMILIEQGKTQKAIDMYKKLIWKFPQKKAYFAAQIEKLTK